MKLSLVVMTPGPNQGKVLEIKLSQFVVGRDPQCHLRPASPMISKRHCAVLQREGKAFVRDFDSTNGTFVNNDPVKGEVELHHGDQLKMGPLMFEVRLQATAPVNRPTPPPPTKQVTKSMAAQPKSAEPSPSATPAPAAVKASASDGEPSSSDDDVAAMLLALHDDGGAAGPSGEPEVPEGSTIHEMPLPPELAAQAAQQKEKDKPKPAGNTSSAAKSILEKYMKRPRT